MNSIRRFLPSILIVLIPFLPTAFASAQPMKLSFDQAWELAQRNNPALRTAALNLEKAKAQIGEAYAAALPVISASGAYKRNFVVPEIEVEFGGMTSRFQFEQKNVFNGSIELVQPIYAAGKVGLALKIAKLYRESSTEQLGVTRSQVKLLVTQIYFGAVLAQEWEKVARETYDQMQDHLKKTEAMYQEGVVSEYDLIRSQVQVSNFYPQVISSQSASKVALESLTIALGMPENTELALTDGLNAYPSPSLPDENLLGIALERRGELRQLDLQENMLKKLSTIEAHGVWWPNLALMGGYSLSAQEPNLEFDDYYWSRNLYGGLTLSIPLFDGFRAHHRTQEVRAALKLLGVQREQVQKGINLEIIQARSRLEEAQKNIQAQKEGVELAQKGLKIAEVQYENGLVTQIEVMDAQIALNQARMNELNARYDYISAQAQMEKALGGE